jgi:hypothetical protein
MGWMGHGRVASHSSWTPARVMLGVMPSSEETYLSDQAIANISPVTARDSP